MKKRKILLILIPLLAAVMIGLYVFNKKDSITRNTINQAPLSFAECVDKNGIVKTKSTPNKCYYDDYIYWEVLKPGQEDLNPPVKMKSYSDCVKDEGVPNYKDSSCKHWTGLVFNYEGPKINSFEECAALGTPISAINPPTCTAPDGTSFTGSRN